MKKIVVILVFFISCIYLSCTNYNEGNSNDNLKSLNLDAGKVHNDMLNKYKKVKRSKKVSNSISRTKSEEFDDMISVVDSELLALGSTVSYSQILNQNPNLKLKLLEIIETEANIDQINAIFDQMHEDEISTFEQNYNSKNLMNLMKQYEGNPLLFNQNILIFENNILNNNLLDSTFKEELLFSISIAKSSHYYWYEDSINNENLSSLEARRGVAIAGADTAGALAGIQSGAVAAASFFGPWGSFAALVGSAAISSMMASGIIK
ncbi:MAG: hypothetical protein RI980_1749 [Bacteroidota bacterium]|jgi:hypothetical protein